MTSGLMVTRIPGKEEGVVGLGREAIEVYSSSGTPDSKLNKICESKTGIEPTCAAIVTVKEAGKEILVVGDAKGTVRLYEYVDSVLKKVGEFSNTVYRVSCIGEAGDGRTIFLGDSMGAIKVYALEAQNGEIRGNKMSDAMGSHTTMVSGVICEGDRIYTLAMDNKVSFWQQDKYQRILSIENVHRGGIMGGLLVGATQDQQRLVTYGGDGLIKVHSLNQ